MSYPNRIGGSSVALANGRKQSDTTFPPHSLIRLILHSPALPAARWMATPTKAAQIGCESCRFFVVVDGHEVEITDECRLIVRTINLRQTPP